MQARSLPASITQIVPRLPPAIDGVGDYAWSVAERLAGVTGITSNFVVCSAPACDARPSAHAISVLGARSRDSLLHTLRAALGQSHALPVVVVHYVGYGYDRNGSPHWLCDGLEDLSAEGAVRIVVVFHELYANVMPWRRGFWYAPSQKSIVKRLLAISTEAMCTVERNERVLTSWSPDIAIARIAIPSSIGDPDVHAIRPWRDRRNGLVIFGLASSRERAYRERAALRRFCSEHAIGEVIDIGPPIPRQHRIEGLRIQRMGAISASDVSAILLENRYGFLNYPAAYLAKSSIFAAYCAHGLASVVVTRQASDSDGLHAGRHYVRPATGTARDREMEQVASEALAWYGTHDARAHAAWLACVCERFG